METLGSRGLISLETSTQTFKPRMPSCLLVNGISFHNISSDIKHHHFLALRLSTTYRPRHTKLGSVLASQEDVQAAGAPDPTAGKPSKSWRNWVAGVLLSLVLPFAHFKWGRLLTIKHDLEIGMKTVETVVEAVETVAEEVAEVADEVADQLPEGGKLKSVVCLVEKVAKETAKDAHIADQLIEKVEEVEKELGSIFAAKVDETAKEVKQADEVTKNDIYIVQHKQELVSVSMDQEREIASEVTQDEELRRRYQRSKQKPV